MPKPGNLKIATIVGARPQFVKAGVVSREITGYPDIDEVLIHTGQHFDDNMSRVFFREMEIPEPKYNLGIHSLRHGAMTGRMLEAIETILLEERPDWVLVYGDTNSTLAGALAARKLHLRLAHVEAGLRSFNMQMPEEINRILTDRISDLLFCPTDQAVRNLEAEGFSNFSSVIVKSGDVMEDAALYYSQLASARAQILGKLDFTPGEFLLCTFHRAENLHDENRLRQIVAAINEIHHGVAPVVVPLHPGTRTRIEEVGLSLDAKVIPPVGYFDMISLLMNCRLVITDSGGLQKEAYFFNKFCVTLRDETEWVELVEGGYNQLVGTQRNRIVNSVRELLQKRFEKEGSYYGGGCAGHYVLQSILENN